MSLAFAILLVLGLIAALFAVAAVVEGGKLRPLLRLRRPAYVLGLGVYCSSWTFYGAVGSAVRDGWAYLPIYLAPILMLLAAPRFLSRLAHAVAQEQASTVSDFIAARFGHDVVVARLVTVIALLGSVPYIALQFRSIGSALSIASGRAVTLPAIVATAVLLAAFAILFGARRFQLAGRAEGLVYAIGLESVIKLATLAVVAGLAVAVLLALPAQRLHHGVVALGSGFSAHRMTADFPVIMLISALAIIVLPRQFYMGLVEAQSPDDLPRARLGLAAYIAAMALLVLPIALAGTIVLGGGIAADRYVLALPLAGAHGWVLGAALAGGISAASSMAIVDATALATMVSNDLIFPTIMAGIGEHEAAGTLGRRMLATRRWSIIGIMALALVWALLIPQSNSLASIGLVAFAAMAQFTPHLILATTGGGRDNLAARASLSVGLVLWFYTLALPQVLPPGWLAALGRGPLDPLHLLGVNLGSPLVHGVCWSLGANVLVLGLVMARNASPPPLPRIMRLRQRVSNVGDLAQLVASFVGEERVAREFPPEGRQRAIGRNAAHRAQELISSVVGASPARALVASALADGQMSLGEVARLLDEGGQALRFSRQLLAATFDNIDSGICVVDAELNLVAWNSRYLEIFDYPPGMVRVGAPVAELIRHNARRGDFGPDATPDEIEHHVAKRLEHLRRGAEHSFERHRRDGRVIKTVGGPMPRGKGAGGGTAGGGYVMSFTDITGEAAAREELRRTLDEMESRVATRTAELSDANAKLAAATRDKTRFLAAASHDLLQPLHAARLFTAALERGMARGDGSATPEMVRRVERSIVAAEGLLRALLDISKLDAGGVQPEIEAIDLAPFLRDIAEGIRPMAQERSLTLRLGPCAGVVASDPALLRSILQNFLTNAVRYAPSGGVVLGVRRRGASLRIDVIDSGIGIAADQHEAIFGEFTRIGAVEEEGLGLGLAIAQRVAQLLGGTIELASRPGRGSRFSLLLPAHAGVAAQVPPAPALSARPMRVLVVDNEPEIVAASLVLLGAMGHEALGAHNGQEALALVEGVEAVLADFQLGDGEDGLRLISALRRRHPGLPAALLTAERDSRVAARARRMKVLLLPKPVAAEAIEAFLAAAGSGAG